MRTSTTQTHTRHAALRAVARAVQYHSERYILMWPYARRGLEVHSAHSHTHDTHAVRTPWAWRAQTEPSAVYSLQRKAALDTLVYSVYTHCLYTSVCASHAPCAPPPWAPLCLCCQATPTLLRHSIPLGCALRSPRIAHSIVFTACTQTSWTLLEMPASASSAPPLIVGLQQHLAATQRLLTMKRP